MQHLLEYGQKMSRIIIKGRGHIGSSLRKSEINARQSILDSFNWIDKLEDLPEELKTGLTRQVTMLKRNHACIRKCELCARIAIQENGKTRYQAKWKIRHYWCSFCKIEKMRLEKPDWFTPSLKRSNQLQPVLKQFWEEYYKVIHQGIVVTK